VAGFSVAAGLIHVVAMVEHFGEHFVYGMFFAVVAVGQLAWGVWIYRRPHERRSLAAAALASIAIVAIWAVSRTTGVPLGPEAGQPEAAGVLDVLASFDEVALAAFVLAILRPTGRLAIRLAGLTADQETRLGVALITATWVGMLLGGHSH